MPSRDVSLDDAETKYRALFPFVAFGRSQTQVMIAGAVLIFVPYFATVALLHAAGGPELADTLPLGSMLSVNVLAAAVFFMAVWFVLDIVWRQMGIAAGLVGIAWATLVIVALIAQVHIHVLSHREAISAFAAHTPGMMAAFFVSAALGLLILGYLAAVVARGAVAACRLHRSERLIMRDISDSSSVLRKSLNRICGLPPIFAFVPWSRPKYALVLLLATFSSLGFAIVALVPQFWGGLPIGHLAGRLSSIERICLQPAEHTAEQRAACVQWLATPGFPWFDSLVLPPLLLGVAFAIAWGTLLLLRRQLQFSLGKLTQIDSRPPVLFLRAFADDQVPLRPPRLSAVGYVMDVGNIRGNLDHMLLEEGSPYGPVVALGNPDDKNPPYGAARGYFDHKTWKDSVADLSDEALAIVICIDDTNGIWWEVEHLAARRHLGKTLFLVHPGHRSPDANRDLIAKIASMMGPSDGGALPVAMDESGPGTIIAFYWDSGELRTLRSSSFSRFAYLLALRSFLREKFGLEARPWLELVSGSIAGRSYRALAIASLVCGLLGFPFIGGLPLAGAGIVTGLIALNRMKKSGNDDGRKFALGGIIAGIVNIVLILSIVAVWSWLESAGTPS